jgi:hypothetical protein
VCAVIVIRAIVLAWRLTVNGCATCCRAARVFRGWPDSPFYGTLPRHR